MSEDNNITNLKAQADAALKEAEKLEAALKEAKSKVQAVQEALAAAEKTAPAPTAAAPAAEAPAAAAEAEAPKPVRKGPLPVGDPVTIKMLDLATEKGQLTIFDRAIKMKPCNIGTEGICCKICSQGPCRLPLTKAIKDGSEPDNRIGLCGATPETIVSRNLIRMISAGTSAHADHTLSLVEILMSMGEGESGDYKIKDESKLKEIAKKLGAEGADSLEGPELYKLVAEKCFVEFGRQDGQLAYLAQAPEATNERWDKLGVKPRGINREAVEIMHRTHMGVDQDYRNLLFQGARCSLADGWGASALATDLQDAFFGSPTPGTSDINLGSLSLDNVNVLVHGNCPQEAELIMEASKLPEIEAYAKSKGAQGIKITGICSTANELQERFGIAGAADYLQQELAIVTGAVEAIVLDAQCAMEALGPLCDCYHTKLFTTFPQAKLDSGKNTTNVKHKGTTPQEIAKEILKAACDVYPSRGQVTIPDATNPIQAGYSIEALGKILKSNGSGPLAPLASLIAAGEIKGVIGLLGCNNVRVMPGPSGNDPHVDLALELIKDDILVLTTGCAAMSLGRAGLVSLEAKSKAGTKLSKFCEEYSLPPVIHLGSCVDNSRILNFLSDLSNSGSLGKELSQLPAAIAIPGWTTEQIVSAAFCFAASGVNVVMGATLPIQGVPHIVKYLGENFAETYGGAFTTDPDPLKQASIIAKLLADKRTALGL
ncbi:MAG: anaerobic carbon-monoxide dehydrogenase catalytic subunit [Deltaproteobacteria bacterium]|jgi:carbon-monoxide dehydrogenase catalytic subunit|nr:anaerobic carbon-monoxide dehydrogenase catalytic subunit [Deltaproteobacteria bacterium]